MNGKMIAISWGILMPGRPVAFLFFLSERSAQLLVLLFCDDVSLLVLMSHGPSTFSGLLMWGVSKVKPLGALSAL